MMDTLILFPGLGANEIIFRKFNFSAEKVHTVKFLIPLKMETLESYSRRIVETIPYHENLTFIGVSFGGILAQEVSKILPAEKIILISSIKSQSEKPFYFLLLKFLPLYKLLSPRLLKPIILMISRIFTSKTKEENELFVTLVKESDTRVIKWGIAQTLKWRREKVLSNIIQIHGTKDLVFPIRKVKADFIIQGGAHFMVIQRVQEINSIVNALLINTE